MTTAIERIDIGIAQVFDQFGQFRVFAKKMLTCKGSPPRLIGLIVAIHGFFHPLT